MQIVIDGCIRFMNPRVSFARTVMETLDFLVVVTITIFSYFWANYGITDPHQSVEFGEWNAYLSWTYATAKFVGTITLSTAWGNGFRRFGRWCWYFRLAGTEGGNTATATRDEESDLVKTSDTVGVSS
jgi:hypothetical protein